MKDILLSKDEIKNEIQNSISCDWTVKTFPGCIFIQPKNLTHENKYLGIEVLVDGIFSWDNMKLKIKGQKRKIRAPKENVKKICDQILKRL